MSSKLAERATKAWGQAGLKRITLHECRHTYASFLMAAGYTLKELMEFMGHADLQMVNRYVGHGPPAVPAVVADQRRYLLMAREAIGRVAAGRAQLTEAEANRVTSLMERYLPRAPLSWLVSAGASAVAGELAQDAAAA